MDTKKLDLVLQDLVTWVVAPMWTVPPIPNWGTSLSKSQLPQRGEVTVKTVGMEYRLGFVKAGVKPTPYLYGVDSEEAVFDFKTPLRFWVDVLDQGITYTTLFVCRRPVVGPQDKPIMVAYHKSAKIPTPSGLLEHRAIYRNSYLTYPSGILLYSAWVSGKYLPTAALLDLNKPPMIFGM